jgi:hypothetical protein
LINSKIMTVVELKEKLLKKIADTDDQSTLERVNWIMDVDFEAGEVYKLSEEEKAAIEEGRNQIRNGQWISHEDLEKEIGEWLKE